MIAKVLQQIAMILVGYLIFSFNAHAQENLSFLRKIKVDEHTKIATVLDLEVRRSINGKSLEVLMIDRNYKQCWVVVSDLSLVPVNSKKFRSILNSIGSDQSLYRGVSSDNKPLLFLKKSNQQLKVVTDKNGDYDSQNFKFKKIFKLVEGELQKDQRIKVIRKN